MQHPCSTQPFRSTWHRWLVAGSIVLASCLTSARPGPLWAQVPTPNGLPSSNAVLAGETIVYIKDNRELRLIQPDGSNDRLLWRMPEGSGLEAGGEIESVAWRPDAQQIAFVSSHEELCSEWLSDIYLINPDGSGLRRLTNSPACAELAAYPQGSVTVQVENLVSNFNQYFIYIEGAPIAKLVTVAPGTSVLVEIPQVADLGDGLNQEVVVFNGSLRWFDAAVQADVVAGQTVHAGKATLTGGGFTAFGALNVSWHASGTKLGFQFGTGRLWQVALNSPLLSTGAPLLDPQTNNAILSSQPVLSPVDNRVLYHRFDTTPNTISETEVDSNSPGTPLVDVTSITGIGWLTDGSGFVAADDDALLSHTDLYLYKYSDNTVTQLTQTETAQAAVYPKVSADSSQIIYTYVPDLNAKPLAPQLRIMNVDGSDDHLLIDGGVLGDWSRVAPQNPPQPTPTATAQGQPTPTATSQGQPTPTATTQGAPTPTPSATPVPGSTPVHPLYLP
ncbi:MAG: hypothetical protein M3Q45_15115, partial [Chloroflexota bacterium]|nr:hypothetical protein [Chloroflexota bacterium]